MENEFHKRAIKVEAMGQSYVIAPSNEPDGEGNGWADCKPEDATQWIVWEGDGDAQEMIFAADTERDAMVWLANLVANGKIA